MAKTLQEVIDIARVPLHDNAKTRYPDTELLRHCNAAMLYLYDKRPDILIGSYSDQTIIPNGSRILGDTFPFEEKYVQPIADVISALAQTKDEENADSGRVGQFMDRAALFSG
jgi:hypothetical protein